MSGKEDSISPRLTRLCKAIPGAFAHNIDNMLARYSSYRSSYLPFIPRLFQFSSILVLAAVAGAAHAADSPRERISINDNWRFIKGDPTNINSRSLLYDIRPVSRGEDQRERLAEATEDAAKPHQTQQAPQTP